MQFKVGIEAVLGVNLGEVLHIACVRLLLGSNCRPAQLCLLLGKQLLALIVAVVLDSLFVSRTIRCLPEIQTGDDVIAQFILVSVQNLCIR